MSDSEDSVQCRSCLDTTATEYIHMESSMEGEYSYIECFNICTNLNANLDDGLPDFICDKCSQNLQVSFNFVNEARAADAKLRGSLPEVKEFPVNSVLDENEYEWTAEDDAGVQEVTEEDMFEDTEMDVLEEGEEYQDIDVGEENIKQNEVKIEEETIEQPCQLESMEHSVKEEQNDRLSPFPGFSEDDDSEEEQPDDKDLDDSTTKKKSKSKKNQERTYTCIVCTKGFESNINLRNHMRNMHREEFKKQVQEYELQSVECEICKKSFLRKNMDKHMEKHGNPTGTSTEQPMLLCAYCPKSFKNKGSLARHEQIHSPTRERKYTCEYCERKFFKIESKIKHIKHIHHNSTERPHVCSVCGKNYKERSALSTHFKVHLSKRFECTQCDKKYPRKHELIIHMRSHTGEKPFQCHLCDEAFKIKNRLTLHLDAHLGAKYKCKVCDEVFDSRLRLRRHKYQHTGLPYRCKECPEVQYYRRLSTKMQI